jgi:hypothetical protein
MRVATTTLPLTYGTSWTGCQLVRSNGYFKIVRGPEIPAVEAILRDIERALEAKLYYLAILICVMIPDICAGLERPDGRTSPDLYKKWYTKHIQQTVGGVPAEECYSLRCGMTHQARTEIKKGYADRVIFTTPESGPHVDSIILRDPYNSAYAFDLKLFCGRWIKGTREWLKSVESNFLVQENMRSMVQLRPHGLAPYIVGTPIIG